MFIYKYIYAIYILFILFFSFFFVHILNISASVADSALVYHVRGPEFDPSRSQNIYVSPLEKDHLLWQLPFSQHALQQCCNHLSIPSSMAEIFLFNLVFYDGVTPVSVLTLKLPLRVIGAIPLKPKYLL